MKWRQILLLRAAALRSEEGENPEYDRALVNLTHEMIGGFDEQHTARLLGIYNRTEVQDYVTSQGYGPITMEGWVMVREWWTRGDDYSTIAHELVFRGLAKEQ